MSYNNHNLYITSTGESIYTYVDDLVETTSNVISHMIILTSNQLIEYNNSNLNYSSNTLIQYINNTSNNLIEYSSNNIVITSNNIINYIDNIKTSNIDVLEYHYKRVIDGNHSNALIFADRMIEFNANDKIHTRITSNGNCEIFLKYDPEIDPNRYAILDNVAYQFLFQFEGEEWIALRDVYMKEKVDKVYDKINEVVNTVSGLAIEYAGNQISLAAKGGAIAIGGVVGAGLTAALTAAGIQATNDENANQNSEKILYNKLHEVMISIMNQQSSDILYLQDYYVSRIELDSSNFDMSSNTSNYTDWTSNNLITYVNTTSNNLITYANTTSNNLIEYTNTTSNNLITYTNTTSNNLITYANTTSNNIVIYTNTTSNNLIEYTNTTSNNLIEYVNASSNSLIEYNDTTSNNLIEYTNTTSNNLIEYINASSNGLIGYNDTTSNNLIEYTNTTSNNLIEYTNTTSNNLIEYTNTTSNNLITYTNTTSNNLIEYTNTTSNNLIEYTNTTSNNLIDYNNTTSNNLIEYTNTASNNLITYTNTTSNNLITYTNTTSNNLITYTNTTSNNLITYTNTTSNNLITYTNTTSNNLITYTNTTSNNLITYNNTTSNNIISFVNTTGSTITTDVNTKLSSKQDKITAGSGISIDGNTISSTNAWVPSDFDVNGATKVHFKNGSNFVGIGTTKPVSLLHLHNTGTMQTDLGGRYVGLRITSDASGATLNEGIHLAINNEFNNAILTNWTGADFSFGVGSEMILNLGANRNVGIGGTYTQNYKLQVYGKTRILDHVESTASHPFNLDVGGRMYADQIFAFNRISLCRNKDPLSINNQTLLISDNDTYRIIQSLGVDDGAGNDIPLAINPATQTDGIIRNYVGIGKTDPLHALDVNGKVNAQAFLINNVVQSFTRQTRSALIEAPDEVEDINTTSNLINNTGFAGYVYYQDADEDTIAKVKAISYTELIDVPTAFPPSSHTHSWDSITGKPTEFAPSSHTHTIANIDGLSQEFINSSNYTLNTSNSISNRITGLSTVYAPISHNHDGTYALIGHSHTLANSGLSHEFINSSNYTLNTSNSISNRITNLNLDQRFIDTSNYVLNTSNSISNRITNLSISSAWSTTGNNFTTGNVGIGTNTASTTYDLDIQNATTARLRILGTGANGDAILALRETSDLFGFDVAYLGNTANKFYIRSYNNSATAVDRLSIDRNDGQVGIGTGTAVRLLHLHNNATSAQALIQFTDNTTTASGSRGCLIGKQTNNDMLLYNYQNGGDIIFATAPTTTGTIVNQMIIDTSGRIGIGGNPSGTYRLEVAGSINLTTGNTYRINGSIVQADWEQTSTSSQEFIKNKPIIPTQFWVAGTGGIFYNAGNVGLRSGINQYGTLSIGNPDPAVIQDNDGTICICRKTGATGRIMRLGYNSTFDFVIGDFGTFATQSWRQQVIIANQAPANSLVIDGSGRFGIGTNTLNAQLHVVSTLTDIALFQHTNLTQGIAIGFNSIVARGSNTDQDINIIARGASGNLFFQTNAATRMTVTGVGRVGIGVTNPSSILHITDFLIIDRDVTSFGPPTTGNPLFAGGGTRIVLYPGSTTVPPYSIGIEGGTMWFCSAGSFKWYSQTTEVMRFIVNSTRTERYLQIFTSTFDGGTGLSSRIFNTSGSSGSIVSQAIDVCLVCDAGAWIRGNLYASSDNRIKKDIQDIDDGEALQKILMIKPKKYKYIDSIYKDTSNYVYGFEAQQIREVLPDAVSLKSSVVPNIYSICENTSNGIYYENTSNIQFSSNLDIDIVSLDGKKKTYKIQDYSDNYIKLNENIENSSNVFIYGTHVDDFHTLNKDYIFALNVCATQELHRIIQEQNERIARLESIISEYMENKNL